MEKFSICNGVAVRYADFNKKGSGSEDSKTENEATILLLHGYLESMEVFEHLAGVLGKRHRVIMMDLPGSGWSQWGDAEAVTMDFMAQTAAAVLEKCDAQNVTVVGHSMGGYVSLALAKNYGQRIKNVVLLHSSPNPDSPERLVNREREISLVEEGKKELLAHLNPGRGFAKASIKRCAEFIEELSDQVMMTEDAAIVATLRGMMVREDMQDFWKTYSGGGMMIFGDDDNYIPREAAEAMASEYVGCEVLWVAGAGHMSFVEQEAAVVEGLERFLSRS